MRYAGDLDDDDFEQLGCGVKQAAVNLPSRGNPPLDWSCRFASSSCRYGLPFYSLTSNAMSPSLCFAFCIEKGMDIFGIVGADECRCGVSTLNVAVLRLGTEELVSGSSVNGTFEERSSLHEDHFCETGTLCQARQLSVVITPRATGPNPTLKGMAHHGPSSFGLAAASFASTLQTNARVIPSTITQVLVLAHLAVLRKSQTTVCEASQQATCSGRRGRAGASPRKGTHFDETIRVRHGRGRAIKPNLLHHGSWLPLTGQGGRAAMITSAFEPGSLCYALLQEVHNLLGRVLVDIFLKVDALGDHALAYAHRVAGWHVATILERAWGSSPQQWLAHTTSPNVRADDRHRLDLAIYGATPFGGPSAATRHWSRRSRARVCPSLAGGPQQLIVLGTQVGGRWNAGARQLLHDLVRFRAKRAPPAVQQAVASTALPPAPPHASQQQDPEFDRVLDLAAIAMCQPKHFQLLQVILLCSNLLLPPFDVGWSGAGARRCGELTDGMLSTRCVAAADQAIEHAQCKHDMPCVGGPGVGSQHLAGARTKNRNLPGRDLTARRVRAAAWLRLQGFEAPTWTSLLDGVAPLRAAEADSVGPQTTRKGAPTPLPSRPVFGNASLCQCPRFAVGMRGYNAVGQPRGRDMHLAPRSEIGACKARRFVFNFHDLRPRDPANCDVKLYRYVGVWVFLKTVVYLHFLLLSAQERTELGQQELEHFPGARVTTDKIHHQLYQLVWGLTTLTGVLMTRSQLQLLALDVHPPSPEGISNEWKHHVVIPYVFDKGLDSARKELFRAACRRYMSKTCIVFMEHMEPPNQTHATVGVDDYTSCYSAFVGASENSRLNLGWCSTIRELGSVMHELGHLLGMEHEQKRPDSQKRYFGKGPYLVMKWENVAPGWEYQWEVDPTLAAKISLQHTARFKAYTGDNDTGYAPYDFESLMHYAPVYDEFDTIPASAKMTVGNSC
ncbi:unnamed protein product [Symbiodinium natans]|uniref:Peptidase M12A domain-containing protein n=1 Tax=Symbiodinium natans TaxID=878477 RepID=A0A812HKL2_9DINO|nr:unnamed protein product [Symbiodinium natans]